MYEGNRPLDYPGSLISRDIHDRSTRFLLRVSIYRRVIAMTRIDLLGGRASGRYPKSYRRVAAD